MRAYVVQTFYIPSGSMEPTLQIGDRIVVSKLSLLFDDVHRGDILVFQRPPSGNCGGQEVNDLVKRVIGLPGDHLDVTRQRDFRQRQTAQRDLDALGAPRGPIGDIYVPQNHYFMMGDNRSNSCDSRSWGALDKKYIVGRVVFRVYPFTRIGFP
jgi:signal peptidase I